MAGQRLSMDAVDPGLRIRHYNIQRLRPLRWHPVVPRGARKSENPENPSAVGFSGRLCVCRSVGLSGRLGVVRSASLAVCVSVVRSVCPAVWVSGRLRRLFADLGIS